MRYGAYNSQKKEENLNNIDKFLKKTGVLSLDKNAADRFGKIKSDLRRKGQLIGDLDILIASITLEHNGILVTNNTEHFKRIADLSYENWLMG